MSLAIDKIILSSTDDAKYIDFWPLVSRAYAKILKIPVLLAFVTEKEEHDEYVSYLRQFGEVVLFKPVEGIPVANQSKIARHYLASLQKENVCYIDDIDLFPLNKDFIVNKVADRPKWHLLCVGAEFWAYGNNGCFPVSQLTSEGLIFKDLFNPRNLSFSDLIKSFVGIKKFHEHKEDISNSLSSEDGNCFSDEYLIRYLRSVNPVKELHKTRGFDWETQTIDRAFWKRFDQNKLDNHQYLFAHCVRPINFEHNREKIQPLIDYVDKNYN